MVQDRKFRKKKLKEIDPDEYEDEIWLAYVEPQYENEYSRMMATQQRTMNSTIYKPVQTNEEIEKQV